MTKLFSRIFAPRSYMLVAVILAWFPLHAQQSQLDTLKKRFQLYREETPIEKLFVHCDRTSYVTGETLWFKVYCVNGTDHKTQDISRAAYLEIIDRNGRAILQTKVELIAGLGNGSLFLPATLKSDNYVVRAYTQWMKNNPSDYFFHQPVTIINTFKSPDAPQSRRPASIDAQFLPEGGSLVSGVNCKVAYRVTNDKGQGLEFTGALINSKNDTLLHFAPSRFGIGNFTFTPQQDAYRAVISTSSQKHIIKLPVVEESGYTLSVNRSASGFHGVVQAKAVDGKPFVYVFAHSRNRIAAAEVVFLDNGRAQFAVDKDKLGEGVHHITIFDAQLQPVCERLVYNKPARLLTIDAKTDAGDYSPRRKVKLSVQVNSGGQPGETNLSVSVFKSDSLISFSHQSISDYLLLSSDLNGNIEHPDYYLSEGSDDDFDNLMLTHGWRKFSWDDVLLKSKAVSFLPESQGATLTGKLYNESGRPAPNIKTYLSSPSKVIRLATSISGPAGELYYHVKDFKGPRKLILQTNFSRDSLYEFRIDNPFAPVTESLAFPDLRLSNKVEKTLLSRSISMQVQDVYNADQYFRITEPRTDSTAFYGKPDERYRLDDYTRFPVMEEVMREYVPGVWVRKRQGDFYFMVIDNINKSVFKEDPLILVDGVPVFKANDIMAFNPLKVKQLDVVDRLFFLGRNTFQGIVSYSTYSGDLSGFPIHPKSVVIDYEGLQLHRTFYAPVYESERQRSNRLPDQRTLLHWVPELKTINGQATVEFYTSDLSGSFEVNVQGLHHTGRAGACSTKFTVNGYDN